MLLGAKLWLHRLLPFVNRWAEVAPACCGTCPTCIGATATGATMTWIGSLRSSSSDEPNHRR